MHLRNQYGIDKRNLALMRLAREWFTYDPGHRIRTISEYCDYFQMARGTIQHAITELEKVGSVVLSKRGVLGTFLESADYNMLWQLSGWEQINVAFDVPVSRSLDTAVRAFREAVADVQLPLLITYVYGDDERAQALKYGNVDLAFFNGRKADELLEDRSYGRVYDLGAKTYAQDYVVVHRYDVDPKAAKAIGYDPNVADWSA